MKDSIWIILVGVLIRYLTTLLVTYVKSYELKERLFIAFAWIPKATVQAALGGVILTDALDINNPEVREEYLRYGNIVLTFSVLAILLTAPIGAMLTITFG